MRISWDRIAGISALVYVMYVLRSCTLNGEQEASLSEATTNYIEARREGALLAYVSMQYPAVVKHYRDQGDSVFVRKFKVEPRDYFSEDPVIRKIKKKNGCIHVLYEAKMINAEWGQVEGEARKFVAISENDGKSWFYMDWSDYVDNSVATEFERLLKIAS